MMQFFKRQVLAHGDDVYLRRYIILRCDRFAVYLHKFERGDEDPVPHDHPWDFTSIVLWGGYTEEQWTDFDLFTATPEDVRSSSRIVFARRGWLSVARRAAEHFHRVRDPWGPCWTLVICGPRRRSWGFQTANGWVEWRTFLGLDAPEGATSDVERNR